MRTDCVICSKNFVKVDSEGKSNPNMKFCSDKCRKKDRQRPKRVVKIIANPDRKLLSDKEIQNNPMLNLMQVKKLYTAISRKRMGIWTPLQ